MYSFFNKHKDELKSVVLNYPDAKELKESRVFHFKAAQDRFEEFMGLEISDEVKSVIRSKVKKGSGSNFKTALREYSKDTDSVKYRLLWLAGCIMSYFSINSPTPREKFNELKNRGEKQDLIALVARPCLPHSWIEYLLRTKSGYNVNSFKKAPGIRNSILYLQDPENNISIMSDGMRKALLDEIFKDCNVESAAFSRAIIDGMKSIGIQADNQLNNGVLYDRILHGFPETHKIIEEFKKAGKA